MLVYSGRPPSLDDKKRLQETLDALELCIRELQVADGDQDQVACQAPREAHTMPDTERFELMMDGTPWGHDAQGAPQAVERLRQEILDAIKDADCLRLSLDTSIHRESQVGN